MEECELQKSIILSCFTALKNHFCVWMFENFLSNQEKSTISETIFSRNHITWQLCSIEFRLKSLLQFQRTWTSGWGWGGLTPALHRILGLKLTHGKNSCSYLSAEKESKRFLCCGIWVIAIIQQQRKLLIRIFQVDRPLKWEEWQLLRCVKEKKRWINWFVRLSHNTTGNKKEQDILRDKALLYHWWPFQGLPGFFKRSVIALFWRDTEQLPVEVALKYDSPEIWLTSMYCFCLTNDNFLLKVSMLILKDESWEQNKV